ncbi:MAG: NUDIX hydrolase [Nitrososphaerales archaeon]|jgi:ADP-ribose pyrophosphatase YjhB (NUDIX family)
MKARREYPSRPLVGAGAVVYEGPRVLLIKRKYPPNEGRWALPGGLVELGERVQDAVVREVKEETGLAVRLEGLLDVATDIHLGEMSRPRYHYVLVDYLACRTGGRVRLNGESSEFGWFTAEQARKLDMSEATRDVLSLHFSRRGIAERRSARGSSGRHSHWKACYCSLFPLSHHSR